MLVTLGELRKRMNTSKHRMKKARNILIRLIIENYPWIGGVSNSINQMERARKSLKTVNPSLPIEKYKI